MGDSIHKNERSESRGDGERRGSRYQENSYFSFSMMEKLLMVMREVDIGIIPSPLPSII